LIFVKFSIFLKKRTFPEVHYKDRFDWPLMESAWETKAIPSMSLEWTHTQFDKIRL
jgi:hypothetical protein